MTTRAFFLISMLAALICGSQITLAQPRSASAVPLETQPADSEARMEMLRVQVVLDRAGFRPGKLDGIGGEFTQAAATRYNIANGRDPGELIPVDSVPEPIREYTLTEEDLKWVGRMASSPPEQAKLSRMPYTDAWEVVSEKFHTDIDYLREINPNVSNPKAGTVFRVPDVEEFSMQNVVALEKKRAEEAKAKEAEATASPSPTSTPSPTPTPTPSPTATPSPTPFSISPPGVDSPGASPEPDANLFAEATPSPSPESTPAETAEADEIEKVVSLVLLRKPRIIEVYENDKLVASYPCTPGSSRVPVPVGTWKITSNVLMPYFRYDKSVLRDGTRSDNAHNIPPGPNNYVGIVWMGINRKSVGIHGTQHPDQIGRNQSSGCIRLANWDAFDLSQRVKKGTPVVVE